MFIIGQINLFLYLCGQITPEVPELKTLAATSLAVPAGITLGITIAAMAEPLINTSTIALCGGKKGENKEFC